MKYEITIQMFVLNCTFIEVFAYSYVPQNKIVLYHLYALWLKAKLKAKWLIFNCHCFELRAKRGWRRRKKDLQYLPSSQGL